MTFQVSPATTGDAPELARVAAVCFPLACPASSTADDVAAFIQATLSEDCFAAYLGDPRCHVLLVRADERIAGYAMLIGQGDGEPVELSKMYVLPEFHGEGAAAQLMRHALDWADGSGAPRVWLGVNRNNERAQRFYRKHGFEVTGSRSFQVGESLESDFVMERRP